MQRDELHGGQLLPGDLAHGRQGVPLRDYEHDLIVLQVSHLPERHLRLSKSGLPRHTDRASRLTEHKTPQQSLGSVPVCYLQECVRAWIAGY